MNYQRITMREHPDSPMPINQFDAPTFGAWCKDELNRIRRKGKHVDLGYERGEDGSVVNMWIEQAAHEQVLVPEGDTDED